MDETATEYLRRREIERPKLASKPMGYLATIIWCDGILWFAIFGLALEAWRQPFLGAFIAANLSVIAFNLILCCINLIPRPPKA